MSKRTILESAVVAALVAAVATGCVGHTTSGKRATHVANGFAVAAGAAMMIAGSGSPDCSANADVSCGYAQGVGRAGLVGLGAIVAGVGAIGIVMTLSTPTEPDAPPPPVNRAPATGTITAPGLTPATVTLR